MGIPQAPGKSCKSLDEFRRSTIILKFGGVWVKKEVSQRRNMQKQMNDNIAVVVFLDIVNTDETGSVLLTGESVRRGRKG